METDLGRVGSAETGSREPSPSSTGLGPSGFDPARWEGKLLFRCGGFNCTHQPGECTADPDYQRYIAWKREGSAKPRQMQMQWHTQAGEVLFYYPSNLSEQDAADVRELLDVAFKGIDRRAAAIAMEARQGRDGETRLDPKDDSAAPQRIAQEEPSS